VRSTLSVGGRLPENELMALLLGPNADASMCCKTLNLLIDHLLHGLFSMKTFPPLHVNPNHILKLNCTKDEKGLHVVVQLSEVQLWSNKINTCNIGRFIGLLNVCICVIKFITLLPFLPALLSVIFGH